MTAASLPSTLVKCLYLFFDLPENDAISISASEPSDNLEELSPTERRALLQKVFVQVCITNVNVRIFLHFLSFSS